MRSVVQIIPAPESKARVQILDPAKGAATAPNRTSVELVGVESQPAHPDTNDPQKTRVQILRQGPTTGGGEVTAYLPAKVWTTPEEQLEESLAEAYRDAQAATARIEAIEAALANHRRPAPGEDEGEIEINVDGGEPDGGEGGELEGDAGEGGEEIRLIAGADSPAPEDKPRARAPRQSRPKK